MIKVIKSGNTVKTFSCEKCGCVFEASKKDYFYIEIIKTNSLNCESICPECKEYAYEIKE